MKFCYIILLLPIYICCFLFNTSPSRAAVPVKAALLYNLNTGVTLYECNANMQVAPASLTKIMTMYLIIDAIKSKKISYNTKVLITKDAAYAGGSAMGIKQGEKIPVSRLLTGTAVSSGNDAATALAIRVKGNANKFVQAMNKKAATLGMHNTRYKNPTGLPAAGQKTTARDLLLLCKSYIKSHPEMLRFHKIKSFMHKGLVLYNTNPLLGRVSGVYGLKTGWTIASGYNLIVACKKGKYNFLAIILGAPNKTTRDKLALKMLEAGERYPRNSVMATRYIQNKVK